MLQLRQRPDLDPASCSSLPSLAFMFLLLVIPVSVETKAVRQDLE
jgi:hypothetical protein